MEIACFGYYNKNNLGDELIKDAMIVLFKQLGMDFSSITFINGKDITTFHNFYNILLGKQYDLMIIGGGGLFPKTTFKEVIKFFILKKLSKKYCFIGVGVNPIIKNKIFFKKFFSNADGGIFRDVESLNNTENAEKEGFKYLTDLVAAFPMVLKQHSNVKTISLKKVCIAVRGNITYEKVNYYKKLCQWLIDMGYYIDYLSFNLKDIGLGKSLLNNGIKINIYSQQNDVIKSIAQCSFMITERFHGVVISLLLKKKFIPIIYDYKTIYLLNAIGWDQKLLFYATDTKSHLKNSIISTVEDIKTSIENLDNINFDHYFNEYQELGSKSSFAYVDYLQNIKLRNNLF